MSTLYYSPSSSGLQRKQSEPTTNTCPAWLAPTSHPQCLWAGPVWAPLCPTESSPQGAGPQAGHHEHPWIETVQAVSAPACPGRSAASPHNIFLRQPWEGPLLLVKWLHSPVPASTNPQTEKMSHVQRLAWKHPPSTHWPSAFCFTHPYTSFCIKD